MSVVTIRGPLGSGANSIARAVATLIGAEYVDRQLIAAAAAAMADTGVTLETADDAGQPDAVRADAATIREPIKDKLSFSPGGIWDRIFKGLQDCYNAMFDVTGLTLSAGEAQLERADSIHALVTVVREIAEYPNVVIRGRASPFILREHPRAFHIFVTASPDVRIRRVAEWLGSDWKRAAHRVQREDEARRAFIKRHFGEDADETSHYDLAIRTDRLDMQTAARTIAESLSIWESTRGGGQPAAAPAT
ncbi:MAG: cytidylate kinase-like family protein [Chloroflexi bacterium]|nr:cytidylate kinase-like family protein [Chloroflexota bacterium]